MRKSVCDYFGSGILGERLSNWDQLASLPAKKISGILQEEYFTNNINYLAIEMVPDTHKVRN